MNKDAVCVMVMLWRKRNRLGWEREFGLYSVREVLGEEIVLGRYLKERGKEV